MQFFYYFNFLNNINNIDNRAAINTSYNGLALGNP